jgi:endonuclease/exonuclease/phosphatase (EEP) superfamily protein YafD
MAACAAALLGSRGWLAELFTHFQLHYAVIAAGLLAVFLWRRQWGWSLALLPFITGAALPLLPYWANAVQAAPSNSLELKLLSANLYAANRHSARVLEQVRRHAPDVIVLTEFTYRWRDSLASLLEDYPFQVLAPQDGGYGIAMLSRRPLPRAERIELAAIPAIDAEVELGGRRVRLLGVHLRSPPGAASYEQRRRQLAELAGLLEQRSSPTVVSGDFNTTPFSPLLRDWMDKTGLTDAARGRGYLATWPTFLPRLGIPIDLCFISGELQVVAHERLPGIGSDHYPILTRFALPPT